MASVRAIKNKSGVSYKIEVSNGYDRNGKKIRYTTTFVPEKGLSKKQCEQRAWIYASQFEEEMKSKKSSLTRLYQNKSLIDFAEMWIKMCENNNLEVSTISRYKLILDKIIFPKLGNKKISEIGVYEVEKFLLELRNGLRLDGKSGGYSDGTIFKIKSILSSIFSAAVRWEILDRNPCSQIIIFKRKVKHKVQCFTLDETKKFLNFIDDTLCDKGALQEQYRVLFYIAVFCGLRRGELLGLTWENIDIGQKKYILDKL